MKYYNKEHFQMFLNDLAVTLAIIAEKGESRNVLKYSKLAIKHANSFGLEESKVGVLNRQDIYQAAFEGLCDMWRNIDWDLIEKKEEGDKAVVNYLSARIVRTIKRQIYRDATGVSIPEYLITKTKAELMVDKLFGNWLYSFRLDDVLSEDEKIIRYIDVIEWNPHTGTSWENEILNDKLTEQMFIHLSDKERDILRLNFGLDCDKVSMPEICKRLGMKQRGVEDAKARALRKLRNAGIENLFEDFL